MTQMIYPRLENKETQLNLVRKSDTRCTTQLGNSISANDVISKAGTVAYEPTCKEDNLKNNSAKLFKIKNENVSKIVTNNSIDIGQDGLVDETTKLSLPVQEDTISNGLEDSSHDDFIRRNISVKSSCCTFEVNYGRLCEEWDIWSSFSPWYFCIPPAEDSKVPHTDNKKRTINPLNSQQIRKRRLGGPGMRVSFWDMVETYIPEVNEEYIEALEPLLSTVDNSGNTWKSEFNAFDVPPLGEHYRSRWDHEEIVRPNQRLRSQTPIQLNSVFSQEDARDCEIFLQKYITDVFRNSCVSFCDEGENGEIVDQLLVLQKHLRQLENCIKDEWLNVIKSATKEFDKEIVMYKKTLADHATEMEYVKFVLQQEDAYRSKERTAQKAGDQVCHHCRRNPDEKDRIMHRDLYTSFGRCKTCHRSYCKTCLQKVYGLRFSSDKDARNSEAKDSKFLTPEEELQRSSICSDRWKCPFCRCACFCTHCVRRASLKRLQTVWIEEGNRKRKKILKEVSAGKKEVDKPSVPRASTPRSTIGDNKVKGKLGRRSSLTPRIGSRKRDQPAELSSSCLDTVRVKNKNSVPPKIVASSPSPRQSVSKKFNDASLAKTVSEFCMICFGKRDGHFFNGYPNWLFQKSIDESISNLFTKGKNSIVRKEELQCVSCSSCKSWAHAGCLHRSILSSPASPSISWNCDYCRIRRNTKNPEDPIKCSLCPRIDLVISSFQCSTSIPECCTLIKQPSRHKNMNCSSSKDKIWVHSACIAWVHATNSLYSYKKKKEHSEVNCANRSSKTECCICKDKNGFVFRCSHVNCSTVFHVICAKSEGFTMVLVGTGASDNGTVVPIAFCKAHTPFENNYASYERLLDVRFNLERARLLASLVKRREIAKRRVLLSDHDIFVEERGIILRSALRRKIVPQKRRETINPPFHLSSISIDEISTSMASSNASPTDHKSPCDPSLVSRRASKRRRRVNNICDDDDSLILKGTISCNASNNDDAPLAVVSISNPAKVVDVNDESIVDDALFSGRKGRRPRGRPRGRSRSSINGMNDHLSSPLPLTDEAKEYLADVSKDLSTESTSSVSEMNGSKSSMSLRRSRRRSEIHSL